MALQSTAELAFVISTNAEPSEAEIQQFRSMMSGTLDDMKKDWVEFSEELAGSVKGPVDAYAELRAEVEQLRAEYAKLGAELENTSHAGAHAVSEMQATSGAIRLLEGSGGIRAMERFTATTLGLGPAMQAIFPVIGALAFTQIIVRMGSEVVAMISKWDPLARAVERAKETAKDLNGEIRTLAAELDKLNKEAFTKAFGEVAGKMAESSDLLERNVQRDQRMITLLQKQIDDVQGDLKQAASRQSANVTTGFAVTRKEAQAAAKDIETLQKQITAFQLDLDTNKAKASVLAEEAMNLQQKEIEKTAKTAAKAKEEFFGLSSVLESLKGKIAGQGSEWAKVQEEVNHYYLEIGRAVLEMDKLRKAGDITADSAKREAAILSQLPEMIGKYMQQAKQRIAKEAFDAQVAALEKQLEAQEKQDDALTNLHRQLVDRLATYDTHDYERKKAQFNKEIDDLQAESEKRVRMTQAEVNLIAAIRKAGLAQIDNEQTIAFQAEITKLQAHVQKLTQETLTRSAQLALAEQRELQQYNEAEETKAKKTAQTAAEIAGIEAFYALARKAITDKYKIDLQELLNSQGWKGVFGNAFKSLLQGDEHLMRQWATSTNQSLLLVKVALQGLKEMGQQAFQQLAQGMGQNIAQAIVYSQSIGQAMRAALAATLESIAAQSITYAIFATALGFLDLAHYDYAAASQAFTAAAIFGTIGVATAIAGKYVAPSQSGAGASGSGAGASGSGSGSSDVSGSIAGGAGSQRQPAINITIEGHMIGPGSGQMLADIINEAVYNNDVTLYASHNAQGTPLP